MSLDDVFSILTFIPSVLSEDSVFGSIVAALFIASIFSLLLSTVDSLLATGVFTVVYDVSKYRDLVDRDLYSNDSSRTISVSKSDEIKRFSVYVASGIISVSLISYYALNFVGFDPMQLLFGAFSAQVALAPVVIFSFIFDRKKCAAYKWAALVAVPAGFLAGLASTFDSNANLIQPLIAFSVSSSILLLGGWLRSLRH